MIMPTNEISVARTARDPNDAVLVEVSLTPSPRSFISCWKLLQRMAWSTLFHGILMDDPLRYTSQRSLWLKSCKLVDCDDSECFFCEHDPFDSLVSLYKSLQATFLQTDQAYVVSEAIESL